jgi:hypothetical protein
VSGGKGSEREPGPGSTEVTGSGPGGHEADSPGVDPKVPTRVFLFVGVFLSALGIFYAATSYEDAGTVMLLGGGALGLWIGVYLWLQLRAGTQADEAGTVVAPPGEVPVAGAGRGGGAAEAVGAGAPASGVAVVEHEGLYLPHASAWPFAIGLGAATLANGLVLGLWVIVPGVALMAIGIGGFVRQTRRRD